MRNTTRRRLRVACVVGAVCVLILAFLGAVQEIHWVSATDLTVEFVVTDAETGEPVKGADVLITSWGGLNDDGRRLQKAKQEKEEIKLTTDEAGAARYVCRRSMCFGTSGPLRLKDTYVVHLPWWHVTTKAPGYAVTEPHFLDEPENVRAVKRVGPQQAKLVVPVALRKSL